MNSSRRIPKKKSHRRKAAVTVEMAMVLPVLFLFFFSQVELVRLNNIRNSVYLSAYEGARTGLIPGATADEVRVTVNGILSAVGAINGTATVTPETITEATEDITVTVSVPLDSNGWIVPTLARGKVLSATVTLKREIDDTVFVVN